MATRRRTRSSRRRRGSGFWEVAVTDPVSLAQNAQILVDLTAGLTSDVLRGSTLVRIIGQWSARGEAVDLDNQIALGIYVQDREGFDAGVAPELQSDNYRYVFWDVITSRIGDLSLDRNQFLTQPVDSKARRRFRGDEHLVAVRENTSASPVSIVSQLWLRLLFYGLGF